MSQFCDPDLEPCHNQIVIIQKQIIMKIIILRVSLVCMKVQAHSSLEPPLEYDQDQMPVMNQGSL